MPACCSDHCSASAAHTARYRKALWIALAINTLMFAVEIGGSLASGSVSLLADAVDFSGDAANYGLSLAVLSRNDAIGNVAVGLAALGVFGTGAAWQDLLVAAVMAGLALTSGISVIRHARAELAVASRGP